MGKRIPAVDAYIARQQPFAIPILERLRELVHELCPEAEERIKWGMPHFEYRGPFAGMAAFKAHATFGFWKARLMADPENLFTGGPRSSPMNARLASVKDLPPKKVLVAYVKAAKRLNDEGIKEPVKPRSQRLRGAELR